MIREPFTTSDIIWCIIAVILFGLAFLVKRSISKDIHSMRTDVKGTEESTMVKKEAIGFALSLIATVIIFIIIKDK